MLRLYNNPAIKFDNGDCNWLTTLVNQLHCSEGHISSKYVIPSEVNHLMKALWDTKPFKDGRAELVMQYDGASLPMLTIRRRVK